MRVNEAAAPTKDQFIIRMPDGMRARLKRLAAANRRSMNAELLLLIEQGMSSGSNKRTEGRIDIA